ncbi:hypothetical protein WR25_00509 isoform A [Diploscapter pachys]|uniref:S-adenosylmethionine decarboxylase proenzyme n=1 Tax=Diploscapter pachys TaxID=2018661 RepID=A0A2A2KY03_9BILA|nr:hypothetical protein WR25_00509 isoform A [Diploscapter pachys]
MQMATEVVSGQTQTFEAEVQRIETPVEEYFFEGAEKLLELWFERSSGNGKIGSLRDIPRDEIDAMLDVARCKILHSKHDDKIDSYVLSESSLFISDNRLIIKTCGSTRLLATLPVIIRLASDYANLDQVQSVYYSRKNFLRPDLQHPLYKSFDAEVAYLDQFFEDGHAYCLGSLKQDRWYLYTMHRQPKKTKMASRNPDHTLEILMNDLDSDILPVFTKDVCEDGRECFEKSGITHLIPNSAIVHDEMFDPCGYSMNAFMPDTDQYATIHVTPESQFSFASFETNIDANCLYKQTKKVVNCFRPGKLLMTVFANENSVKGKDAQQQLWECELPGYKRTNVQFVRLETETLVYANFVRRNTIDSDEDDGERSE